MPYGTVQADVIGTSVSGSNLGAGNASIMKNRIINGATLIDQRNNGTSITLNDGSFPIDRFAWADSVDGKFTGQQNSGNAPTTQGFTSCLKLTSTSAYSVSSTDYFLLNQNIEGFNVQDLAWGTASAKTITLSFWVNCSLTGTFGGVINNGANDRSYAYTYTISSANTWEYKTVTIAGDTSGTWITNNGLGMRVRWALGAGSSRSTAAGSWNSGLYLSATGATSVVGTNGATFYITGVQLEVGSSATGYEYRQYTTEYQLCQRYYNQYANGTASFRMALGENVGTTRFDPVFSFPVTMRTTPTLSYSSVSDFASYSGNNLRTCTGLALDIANYIGANLIANVTSGLTSTSCSQFVALNTSNRLAFSAEL